MATPHTGLKVYLIRHAESSNNVLCSQDPLHYEDVRDHDPALSPSGEEQAKQLGEFIARHPDKFNLFEVHCSAMYRSLLTTEAICKATGMNPEVWVDLHEVKGCRQQGVAYPGKSRSQIESRFPNFKLPSEVTEEGWFLLGREETEEEAWDRAKRVWSRLKEMNEMECYQGKSIAIVSHGMFLDFLLGRLCNRGMKDPPRFVFYNTGYSLVWLKKPKTIVHFLDRIEHLAVMPLLYRDGNID